MESARGDEEVGRLTPGQKECLRLVMAGYRTKEIARLLRIGDDAVNKRLAGAKATLGSPSRFHAARLLAAHEGTTTYHSAVGGVSAVASEIAVVENDEDEGGLRRDGGQSLDDRDHNQEASHSKAPPPSGSPDADADDQVAWPVLAGRCSAAFAIAAVLGAILRILMRS